MVLSNCVKDPTLELEFTLLQEASTIVALDEVGRGALAGPVAVGAHVFTLDSAEIPCGLRDSKLMSEKKREAILPIVESWGAGAVGYCDAAVIDAQGIMCALGLAAVQALQKLPLKDINPEQITVLVDGNADWLSPVLNSPLKVVTKVGADRACASVAAASVRAKVYRDRLMVAAAQEYPEYGWASNKGYGSHAHREAIAKYGVTQMHRKTWIKN